MAAAAERLTAASCLEGKIIEQRYRVLGRLGGGGMGEVYEVEHVRLERRFAMKILRAELTAFHELTVRFDREARAVARLHSDYVVGIVDSGALSDGRPYFVMDRLLGQDLRQLLATTPQLPVTRAVNLAIDVCFGLHAAHGAGLVHRDLKPENLFVTRTDDGRDRCKILDFGVVKLSEQEQTLPGALLGTARYMAPEQIAPSAEVGPRTDLFALGVILYRSLTGEHPFVADSLERVLFRIMNDAPRPVAELAPHVPPALSDLIASAISKSVTERPASALDLARSLGAFVPEARRLEVTADWRIRTRPSAGTPVSDADTTGPTPALAAAAPVSAEQSRPSRALRWAGAGAALALVMVALLTSRSFLHGAPRTESTRLPAVTSQAPPSPTLAPSPALGVEPLGSAAAAPSAALPPASHRKALSTARVRPAELAPAPSASSAPAAATAASPLPRPSVNWFDPRNPYGK